MNIYALQVPVMAIFEEKQKRQRATPSHDTKNTKWVWEEDK